MSKRDRPTREQLRESMRQAANTTRDTADEMAAMYGGCDDPLHPWLVLQNPWNNWIEFVDQVCRPLVEGEGDEAAVQAAMKLYRKVNPHYLCVALVMAANRLAPDIATDLSVMADAYDRFRSDTTPGPEGRKARERAHFDFVTAAEKVADAEIDRRGAG